MLEIVILVVLAGKIGKIAEQKGRNKVGYQFMLVGMWIAGELGGGLIGVLIGTMASGDEDGGVLLGVLGAVIGVILAAVGAFYIVKNLEPIGEEGEFYRGIEYADDMGVRERFRDRDSSPRPATDAYTDNPENARRPLDDRIQE